MSSLDRRRFLQASAALGGALVSSGIGRSARAAALSIDAPIVDRVVIREITDNSHNIFLGPLERPGLSVHRVGFPAVAQGKTLESEWGLALHVESTRGDEPRRYLLDFGFTPDVYTTNLEILKIDPTAVDALILSHGHFDHYGGLIGFLETRRAQMRKDLRLYTGGEDDFCRRFIHSPDGSLADFNALDRRKLKALNVEPVLSEDPTVIEGHAFTTGVVPRTSTEHVLPNTWVEIGIKDGLGCDPHAYISHHFSAEELAGKPLPTSIGTSTPPASGSASAGWWSSVHVDMPASNTLKRAQEVSGVEKIYALVGGFHLAPAPDDYLRQVMAELKKFDLEHVMPMHCSGQNFVDLANKEMPEKLVLCGTGSSFIFTA